MQGCYEESFESSAQPAADAFSKLTPRPEFSTCYIFFHSPHHVQYPRHVREWLWEVPADVIACHGTRAVEGIRRVTKFLREKGDIYACFGEPTCMQVGGIDNTWLHMAWIAMMIDTRALIAAACSYDTRVAQLKFAQLEVVFYCAAS